MGLPGLLQAWGIGVLLLVWAVALFAAYRWHSARPARPALYPDVAAAGLLALLTGGFFWRVLTESGVWMPAGGGDLAAFYYPTYVYVAGQIKAGSIPLWNPHLFSGMPMAADVQTGLFYPINWMLYLFVQVDYGSLEWLLIAHYWLAAVFTYTFVRDLGLSRVGALTGGVGFAFCGFMTAHLGHLPMILVAAWIPLVLLCVRRAMPPTTPDGSGRYGGLALAGWAWAIAAGLVMTISMLAGHVQIFAYELMAAALLWLYLLVSRWSGSVRQVVVWLGRGLLMLAIVVGLGAVQLLPAIELNSQSVRSALSYEEASQFSAQPVTMLNMLLPHVYGSNPTNYSFGPWQTTENWGYGGLATLALAVCGLIVRRERMVGYFALLVVLGLLIMVGDLSIVGAWLYRFAPGFSTLRSGGRALVLFGLGVSVLAAYGIDWLAAVLSRPGRLRRWGMWWLVGLSAALVLLACWLMPSLYVQVLSVQGAESGRLPTAINDAGMAAIWLGLLAGVGWAAYTGRLAPRAASAAMLAIVVLDIFSVNSRFNPTTTDILAGYRHADAVQLLAEMSTDPRTGIPLRVNSDSNAQDVWYPSSALLSGRLYDTGGAFNPLELRYYYRLWDVARRNFETPLYDLTGAAFEIASPVITRERSTKWDLIERFEGFDVYRNNNVLPRAFLVHEVAVQHDPDKIVESLRNFDVEPRHTVVLEMGTPVTSSQPGTAEAYIKRLPTNEWVRATRYTPHDIVLMVRADTAGWVVLTDAWYPGWEAAVDGRSTPLERAFAAYRAVHVDAGEHIITMRFRPWTWQVGWLVSFLTLVGVLTALALMLVLTRRAK